MGGSNTKALYLCETIYPSDDGSSCIPPEKLQKAIAKGEIPPQPDDDEDLDEDEDEKIDSCIREVWAFYDKKQAGFLNKKQTQGFFKDALSLFAIRKGVKAKDLLGQGVSMSKALEESFNTISNGTGRCTFENFEEFINMSDLEEALALITGNTGPVDINVNDVQLANVDDIPESANAPGKKEIVYRNYDELED
eukprot:TRINITY_DN15017_c6_g1_i1.p1 TRINITY_DN15017_c6_g1~~TRINITY_DN15017_c6_g1_i1.p1  ORF type:complete len:194 (-),score=68.89 TRINITY_DN15017_c6_g1_i1:56-637(-)